MGVDLQTYRSRIGTFGRSDKQLVVRDVKHTDGGVGDLAKLIGAVSFIGCLLLIAGVETNPGPGVYPKNKASERDIAILSQYIVTNWELLGPFLGVNRTEIGRIQQDNGTTVLRVHALLHSWRQAQKDEATLDKVFEALETLEKIGVDWQKLSEKFNFEDPSQCAAQGPINVSAKTDLDRYAPGKVSKRASERQTDFIILLKTFGMKEHYPGKITLQLALSKSLRFMEEENDTGKFSRIYVPWYMLNGILTLNSETRDTVLKKCKDLCNRDSSNLDTKDINYKTDFSALDILVSVFQCCDMRLKQILTKKLFDCQIAIPFLISTFVDSSNYVLNVWPLRFTSDRNKSTISEHFLFDSKTVVISFARIGRPEMSKSCVLNYLIRPVNTTTFFNKDSFSGMARKCIGSGYVELFSCSKDDSYLTYINVRGDILLDFSTECIHFLSSISDVFVLNVTEQDIHVYKTEIIQIVSRFRIVIVMSDVCKERIDKYFRDLCRTELEFINYRTENLEEMTIDISEVTEKLPPQHTFETKLGLFRLTKICKDEEDAYCKECYEFSIKLIDTMNDELRAWASSKLAIHKKDTHWREVITPASYCISPKIRDKIKQIRKCQNDENVNDLITLRKNQIQSVSRSVTLLLNWLLENRKYEEKVYYGLCWINIGLRKITRDVILESRQIIDTLQKKVKSIQARTKTASELEQSSKTSYNDNIKKTNDNIRNASINVDHLIREIGHICTSALYLQSFPEALARDKIDDLAELFAEMTIQCYAFEVIDGDSDLMATDWIKLFFSKLELKIKPARTITLSVLGGQSSGKSTILNTLFGTDFPIGSGRTTSGIHGQLLPIWLNKTQQYVLILDTEGVMAPERADVSGESRRDKEISTFVTSIGDVTLINTMGESPNFITGVLKETITFLLRFNADENKMKKRTVCKFIQHNVTANNAGYQNRSAIENTMNILDRVTKEAAESENMGKVQQFEDIMHFSKSTDVIYLPHHSNSDYHLKVNALKKSIFKTALKIEYFKSFNEIQVRVEDIWKDVENEKEMCSFRNTMERKITHGLQSVLERILREYEYSFRCGFLNTFHVQFLQNNDKFSAEMCKERLHSDCDKRLDEAQQKLKKKAFAIFDQKSREEPDFENIIYQCRGVVPFQVNTFITQLNILSLNEIDTLCEKRKAEISVLQKMPKEACKIFLDNAICLAYELKGRRKSEEEINKRFEKLWESFLNDNDFNKSVEDKTVLAVGFEKGLEHIQELQITKESILRIAQQLDFNLDKTLLMNDLFPKLDLDDEDFVCGRKRPKIDAIKHNIIMFLDYVYQDIEKLCMLERGLIQTDITTFLSELSCTYSKIWLPNINLGPSVKRKLYIHVCQVALQLFTSHNETYLRNNALLVILDNIKEDTRTFFSAKLNDIQNVVAENLFCNHIRPRIFEFVVQKLKAESVEHVFSVIPETKPKLLEELLKHLSNETEICEFLFFIEHPFEFAGRWVDRKATKCLYENNELYALAERTTKTIFNEIQQALKDLGEEFKKRNSASIGDWLDVLLQTLGKYGISKVDFQTFKCELPQSKNEFDTFLYNLVGDKSHLLEECRIDVIKQFKKQTVHVDTDRLTAQFKRLWGCTKQCPFCGEPCVYGEGHKGINHICFQHRPGICRGIKFIKTNVPCLEACGYKIQTEIRYNCETVDIRCQPNCNKHWHSFNDYKTMFPDWTIDPIRDIHTTSLYWKWFICNFKEDLEQRYNTKLTIPDSWTRLNKDQALECLKNDYNVHA